MSGNNLYKLEASLKFNLFFHKTLFLEVSQTNNYRFQYGDRGGSLDNLPTHLLSSFI